MAFLFSFLRFQIHASFTSQQSNFLNRFSFTPLAGLSQPQATFWQCGKWLAFSTFLQFKHVFRRPNILFLLIWQFLSLYLLSVPILKTGLATLHSPFANQRSFYQRLGNSFALRDHPDPALEVRNKYKFFLVTSFLRCGTLNIQKLPLLFFLNQCGHILNYPYPLLKFENIPTAPRWFLFMTLGIKTPN